jgi:hypothetical protein
MTLCPSAPCAPGALLIGRVVSPTKVAITPFPIKVTQVFMTEVSGQGAPEKHFRFASPCQGKGCQNWKGGQCQVPADVTPLLDRHAIAVAECGIRDDCRWFGQSGYDACAICTQVTTDRDS